MEEKEEKGRRHARGGGGQGDMGWEGETQHAHVPMAGLLSVLCCHASLLLPSGEREEVEGNGSGGVGGCISMKREEKKRKEGRARKRKEGKAS